MNEKCAWPAAAEDAAQWTLVSQVRIAEELAMRYADANFDSKSRHGQLRSHCETKLFTLIAQRFGVFIPEVEQARRELDARVWDPPVHLPLVAFYFAAVLLLARHVRRRFARDEIFPAGVATLFASLSIAIVFQVLGHLWDGLIEMIRLGSTHMSYRAERLGWRAYGEEVFVMSMLLFWCAVLFLYWTSSHPQAADHSAHSESSETPVS
jgi:hypothetical protein